MSNTPKKTYTLASASFVHAPGIVRWAISGAKFPDDADRLVNIIATTWSVPKKAARALVLEQVPFHVVDGNAVRFVV